MHEQLKVIRSEIEDGGAEAANTLLSLAYSVYCQVATVYRDVYV